MFFLTNSSESITYKEDNTSEYDITIFNTEEYKDKFLFTPWYNISWILIEFSLIGKEMIEIEADEVEEMVEEILQEERC